MDFQNRNACFTDAQQQQHTLTYNFIADDDGVVLTVTADDGSVCSFAPCLPPNDKLWFATGLVVNTPRRGIASHIYALVRDLLKPHSAAITPSGNLFPDGVKLWATLDPGVRFQEQADMPGYYEPA